jgi:hypothetical protein
MGNDVLMIKSVFLFFSIWGITVLLLWFRPRIELFWKIIATLIFIFYLWFFFNELQTSFAAFKTDWYLSVIEFLKEILIIFFAGMLIIWPVVLMIIFYKANDIGAEKLLRFLCLLTIILWIVFIIYFFFSTGIEKFFYQNLKKMIPKAG